MLRPVYRVARTPLFTPCRTKVIFAESFLDKAERLHLWNRDNKLLFGALVESSKDKAKRLTNEPKIKGSNHVSKDNTRSISNTQPLIKVKKQKKNVKICLDERLNNADKIFSKTNRTKFAEKTNTHSVCNPTQLNKPRVEILASNSKNSLFTHPNVGVPSIIIRNFKMFPMMSNQKVDLVDKKPEAVNEDKIIRVTSSGTQFMNFPSVTRVLDQTMSEESRAALEKWKQEKIEELGLEGFEKFNKTQLERGTQFHNLLSEHFLSVHGVSAVDSALEGVWSSVSHVLKELATPKAIESHVVHPVLKYKGIIDCIAMYQDKPTLIEWKKSNKPKPALSATYDNPVQLAAYFGAVSHDANYKPLHVRDALLVIAYTDGNSADVFHLNADQMRQHWAAWLSRLEKYWTVTETRNEPENKKIETEKL
ncbi:mitochondrial genome maintenance exonuclease 1-like [Arctopsyche grandis]|uniref:mitochondrial genome maintenance exonuclease 1-like n=1 Tax=Arctopsyche grandis TaxID=121162 RepID=UPI00406D6C59